MMSPVRFLIVPVLLLTVSLPAQGDEPFRYPGGKHGKGELKYIEGVPVLVVEGTPDEIGEQVGVLAGKPAKRLMNYPQEAVSHLATPVGMKLIWPTIVKQGNKLHENFPEDYRRELDAMIKTSGVEREPGIIANTIFDLKYLFMALFGCSALVVDAERSQTGQPLFGRNMDHLGLGYLPEYTLVTVYRPKGKHAFASIGWPGVVGVISGINDAGLAVAALETTGAPKEEGPIFDPKGVPFALCYRRVLEECTTVEEAEKLLRDMKRATTNNLAVCDKKSSAVFEFTPTRLVSRRGEKGMCLCTNHFCTAELKLAKPKNTKTTLDRYATLTKALAEEKKLGVADVQRYLDAANQGEETLQTMIFEPAALTLHLATADGKKPASGQKLKKLDLSTLLKR
jgi:isopenicillin-N N-acyltransferase-like protein